MIPAGQPRNCFPAGLWTTTRASVCGCARNDTFPQPLLGSPQRSCGCWPVAHKLVPSWTPSTGSCLPGLLLDPVRELGDGVEGAAPLGQLGADAVVGVHDRGVVATAELLTDLRQGEVGQLAAEVHRDLPAGHQVPRAARSAQVL